MARMRVIGSSFDKGYRDDLNYNFGLLEALIVEVNGLTDNLREEMLEKIYNLQQQIDMLTGENIGELLERLNDSIQQALTAAQEARTAKTATEEATALATTATELANASSLLAEEKANYANEKAVLAQEAADNANQEASNLSQLKIDVVQATQDANTATGNANQATQAAQTATDAINVVLPNVTGLVNLKEWSIETQYKKNNFVTLEGNGYMALRDNKGVKPPSFPVLSNADWAMFVQKGEKGEQGTGVRILGTLPDESSLPPIGEPGDAYLINGNLYVWSDTTNDWTNVGTIKGPKGDTGPQGPEGPQGLPGKDADLTEVNQEIANIKQTVTDNQQVVTEHLGQIATTEKLGHIKPDGETITVDPVTGVASATVANIDTKAYSGDLNNLTENGYYSVPANTPNAPTSSTPWLVEVAVSADATYVVQTARHGGSNNLRENVFQRVAVKDGSGQFIWGTVTSGMSGYLGNWKIVSMNISDAIDSETPLTGASSKAVKQLNDSKANKIQETSFSPSLQNGWLASSTPKLYKDEFGVVHLTAEIHSGTTASGTTMLTLPVNYRPNNLSNIVFMGITYANNSGTSPVSAINFFVSNGEFKTLYTAQKYVLIDISFRV
ncbi:hypothetical protein LBYS11_16280 [Lysinibacillus sp. YS11]|uniref:collagen-like triple helix repeat-containing protein n=1 Tax=Lysinibacillus sp. YS11 TaxID=2072025 RepID=UPI000CA36109|nr:collagen-like protein [Lysinibacillus sp. YS11]AUS87796.1 hypothetical protein LBYS11_16280 [Lysinibacillus sp. YS11]